MLLSVADLTALGYHRPMKPDKRMLARGVLTAAGFVLLGLGIGHSHGLTRMYVGLGALCLATVLSFLTGRG